MFIIKHWKAQKAAKDFENTYPGACWPIKAMCGRKILKENWKAISLLDDDHSYGETA